MLQPLLPEIVFVGGCATGLLITDPGAAAVRGTYDVDVIAEIASYADYVVFSDRLHELGFHVDGRTSIVEEVQEASPELRDFIGEAVRTLLAASRFRDALSGYLPPDAASQARIGRLFRTLDELSRLAPGS